MLALLSDIFYWRSIDVLSRSHWRYLNSSVSYAFSSNELFIQFGLCLRFLNRLYKRFFLSESSNNIEIFCLHNMVLFCFENLFLLSLLKIHLFLHIEWWLWSTLSIILNWFLSTHKVWTSLVVTVFRFQCYNRTLFLISSILLIDIRIVERTCTISLRLIGIILGLSFLGVVLRSCYSLRHSHHHFLRRWLLWVILRRH